MANFFYESGNFIYAEPDFLHLTTPLTNDTYFADQWALENTGQYSGIVNADMDVLPVWTTGGTQGEGIVVAIIDEGVDLNHPDLKGTLALNNSNLVTGYDAVQPGFPNPPNNIGSNGADTRNDAHGTPCAGIVSAIANNGIGISGVYPLSKIMPIRIAYTDPASG